MSDKPVVDAGVVGETFLLAEQAQAATHYHHVESRMHDVLKFYCTLLLGLLAASLTFVQLSMPDGTSTIPPTVWRKVAFMWVGFWGISGLLIVYFLELRIRKIKFVEQIVSIRATLIGEYGEVVKNALTLISAPHKAPPFLRRPCAEWYALVMILGVNAIVVFFECLRLLDMRISMGIVVAVVSFLLGFGWITLYAYRHDLMREQTLGLSSEYELLGHGLPPVLVLRPLGWFATWLEGLRRERKLFFRWAENLLEGES